MDLILLHGALGAPSDFDVLGSKLIADGFVVHRPGFSGHGKIPFGRRFGIHQFADELRHYVVSNNLERPNVFGYSMGGYVALHLAAGDSTLLGKIVTFATKLTWSRDLAEKETRGLQTERLVEKAPAFVKMLEEKHGPEWKSLVERTSGMINELADDDLYSKRLNTVSNSVLVGLGDRDHLVTLDETATAYRLLQNGSMYVLPDTKHAFESTDTELLCAVVGGFLKRV
jgi:esterase/lipase